MFFAQEEQYLGHTISKDGIRLTEEKVKAKCTTTTKRDRTKSFLELLNYYSIFLPNLSTVLAPLYNLLQKKSHWFCGSEQLNAFFSPKLLNSPSLLAHYNIDNDLALFCDASPYGVRAVLEKWD